MLEGPTYFQELFLAFNLRLRLLIFYNQKTMKNNLVVLFVFVCLCSLPVQSQLSITRTSESLIYPVTALDFGIGWMIGQYKNQTAPCVALTSGCVYEFIFWKTSSTYSKPVNLKPVSRVLMVTSKYFYYRVVVLYTDFSLELFEVCYYRGVISKLNLTVVATDIVKGRNGYAYFISKPDKMAYKIDLNSTFSIVRTKAL